MSAPLIGRGAKHSFHHSTHSIRSLVKASPGSPPPPQCHRSREPASPIPGRRHHPAASRGWVRVSSASGADCRQRPCHRVDALRALSRCNTAVVRRSALHGLAHDVCFDSLSASATKLPTSLGLPIRLCPGEPQQSIPFVGSSPSAASNACTSAKGRISACQARVVNRLVCSGPSLAWAGGGRWPLHGLCGRAALDSSTACTGATCSLQNSPRVPHGS